MRIAAVGTNFIVSRFIEAAGLVDGASVEAVFSRSEQNAATLAQKHGIPRTFTDRDALLRVDDIDFIYVALPNSLHYEWTKAALLAGKNVICEKPFVPSRRQLSELITLAQQKDLFLFEGITLPFLPNYRLLKEHLSDIGRVGTIQLNYSQLSSRYEAFLRGENPNVFTLDYAGGALMDLNYYNLNFMLGLFETPQDIRYFPNLAPNGIDLAGALVFTYTDKVGVAVACKDSRSENLQQIQGDLGYIQFRSPANTLQGGFDVVLNSGKTAHYDAQRVQNPLYYEMTDFADIFHKRDFARRDLLLAYNAQVIGALESVRLGAGIRFPSDEES